MVPMVDEATVCAAAYFRSVGKDVTTSDEFVMTTSLELKWMSPSESKLLLKRLLELGLLNKKGDFIRTSSDLSGLDVPLAYKPSPELIKSLHEPISVKKEEKRTDSEPDLFHVLMEVALSNGIAAKDFVPSCSKIQKRLGIDISVAALIVLRDNGLDIAPYIEKVRDNVRSM